MLKKVFDPSVQNFSNKSFWKQFSPELSIEQKNNSKQIRIKQDKEKSIKEKIILEGFCHLRQPGLKNPTDRINQTISSIVKMGLPPVFIFIYDEPWLIQKQVGDILKTLLGDDKFKLLPGFWAWYVPPGESGWKPHRDRPLSLFEDFSPQALTLWVPLTKAVPENSCMYMLPANKDIHYRDQIPPELKHGFPGKLSDIQALPSEPNDILIWNQRVVHWGSTSNPKHEIGPRISLAYEYQRSDVLPFNEPLLEPNKLPTFKRRLNLIGMQIIQYTHMYGFNDELVDLAKNF